MWGNEEAVDEEEEKIEGATEIPDTIVLRNGWEPNVDDRYLREDIPDDDDAKCFIFLVLLYLVFTLH